MVYSDIFFKSSCVGLREICVADDKVVIGKGIADINGASSDALVANVVYHGVDLAKGQLVQN